MTATMSEKIEELAEKYKFMFELSAYPEGAKETFREAILYGRTSALDEVEPRLPEQMFGIIEYHKGFTDAIRQVKDVISRIRSETSGNKL